MPVTIRNIKPLGRGVFVYKDAIMYCSGSSDILSLTRSHFVESESYFNQCVWLLKDRTMCIVLNLVACKSDYTVHVQNVESVCLWDPQDIVRGDEIVIIDPHKVALAPATKIPLTEEQLDYLESLQTLRNLNG